MSNTKFTPGPWSIDKPKNGDPNRENYNNGIITIRQGRADNYSTTCTIYPCGVGFKRSMINAKLIAAAPELLEALIAITSFIDKEGPASKEWKAITECNEKAKAVIKKATE